MTGDVGPRAVIFDWDGTLVDSAEGTFRSYVFVFDSFGIPYDRSRFAETYSPNWLSTYRAVGLAEEDWPEADRRWLLHFGRESHALLPGAREALSRLESAGKILGLVTSGERERIMVETRALGVADFFAAVVCGDDLPHKKPRPEPLLHALSMLGLRPEDAAYIGDSPEDMHMTRAAGAFAIAVPGAFPNHEALAAAEADARASSLGAAVDLLLERGKERIRSS